MLKKKYSSPFLFEGEQSDGGNGSVIGGGTGQGSIPPEGMSYEEWWSDIALEGTNEDCDYNGDGTIDIDDYNYYIDNELWKG